MSVACEVLNWNPQNCHLQLPNKNNQSQPDVSPKRRFLVTFPVVRETSQTPPESRQKPPRPRVVPLESYRAGDSPDGSAMYGNFSGSKPVNHLEPTTKISVISWKSCVCQIPRVCWKLSPQQKKQVKEIFGIFTLKTFQPLRVLSESLLDAALIFSGLRHNVSEKAWNFSHPPTNF